MKTPVVFIIFNRPETTARVFAAIRQAKPSKLFVVADGPRVDHPEDVGKCASARAIIDGVDWGCEVFKDYADKNLGCQYRLPSGLDWAFSLTEEAVILEDDCLPHPTFFRFCEELLAFYRDDVRVAMISGQNNLMGRGDSSSSYYFSKYPFIWGWATWKRAWKCYDGEKDFWPRIKGGAFLRAWLQDRKAVHFWHENFSHFCKGRIDTWCIPWAWTCFKNGWLCVTSSVNLVSNIGFGRDSTHTKDHDNGFAGLSSAEMAFPLRHPASVVWDASADKIVFSTIYDHPSFFERISQRIKSFLYREPSNRRTAPVTIGIVTPSLGQALFINKTLRSVLSQEGEFFIEHVVMDGGSSDGTVDILKQYEADLKSGRLKPACRGYSFSWRSEKDGGQSEALNKGFAFIKGDILCWLNSDDRFTPGALQAVVDMFRSKKADVLMGRAIAENEAGKFLWRQSPKMPVSFFSLFFRMCPPQPSIFFKKDILKRVGFLDESLHYVMDHDLWIRMYLAGGRFLKIPRDLSIQTYHPASKSCQGSRLFEKSEPEREVLRARYALGRDVFWGDLWEKAAGSFSVKKANFCKNIFRI